MTTKKKASMIGHDPLAWINEGSPDEASAEAVAEVVEHVQEREEDDVIAEQAIASETIGDVLDAALDAPDSMAADVIKLEGDLTIQGVQALHDLLSSALEQVGDIQLDADAVGRVDTAAMQTLYAFAKKVNDGDRNFSWLHEAESIKEVATTLGMADVLQV